MANRPLHETIDSAINPENQRLLAELQRQGAAFLAEEAAATGLSEDVIALYALSLFAYIRQATRDGETAVLLSKLPTDDATAIAYDAREVEPPGHQQQRLRLRETGARRRSAWPPAGWTDDVAPVLRLLRREEQD